MKILVIGGCGYRGSHTCVQLIQARYVPIVLDNLCNSKASVLNRVQEITSQSTPFYQGGVFNEYF